MSTGIAVLLAVALSPATAVAAPQSIDRFVGGVVGSASGAGSGEGEGEFVQPRGIAVNESGVGGASAGDVYVVDSGNERVQVFDASGGFKFAFGSPGAAGGEFDSPQYAAVDQDTGRVYVSDRDNRRVQVFSAGGVFERAFGFDVVASGGDGDVVIAGNERQTVQPLAGTLFTGPPTGGTFTLSFGGQTTPAIAYNASAAVVEDELQALSSIGAGNVAVTGPAGGTFTVEFVGDLAGIDVAALTGDGSNLIGLFGSGGTVNVSTTQQGGPQPAFEICTVASECKAGVAGSGVGQFGAGGTNATYGIAVSPPDGNAGAGTVYLANSANRRVETYALDGTGPSSFGSSSNFGSDQPRQIAVDSQGIVFASDSNSSAQIDRYDSAGVHSAGTPGFLASIGSAALGAGGSTATIGLQVDTDTDDLYVLRDPSSGNTVIRQLGPVNDPGALAPPAASDETHMATDFGTLNPNGLGLDSVSGNLLVTSSLGAVGRGYYVLDEDGTGTAIAASEVGGSNATATTADMVGTVDPADGLVWYRFQYSADGDTYESTPYRSTDGSGARQVAFGLTDLVPNTLYRVRLRVEKVVGPNTILSVESPEGLLVTDAATPSATTLRATHRRATAATLLGTVNPNGSATTYHFEYGTTDGYGNSTPVPAASAGAGGRERTLAQPISGLQPDTTYHYRLVAENAVGTSSTPDTTFTTRPAPSAADGRAYELVSPADKLGGQGVGIHAVGDLAGTAVGYPSRDGERFALNAHAGAILVDSPFAYANDIANAERGDGGWTSRSPIARRNYGNAQNRFLQPRMSSDNLEITGYVSNGGHVGVFPEVETLLPTEWEVLSLGDWYGRWEVFGPTAGSPDQTNPNSVQSSFSVAIAGDGSHVALYSDLKGLSGPGDPTLDQLGDSKTVYINDVSAGLSDSFPGAGVREPVGVCTAGTELPSRLASGKLDPLGRGCPEPLLGRDGSLVDLRGAGLSDPVEDMISQDGSRVFFVSAPGTATPCSGEGPSTACPAQLFVRVEDADGDVAVRWISRPQVDGQDASLLGETRFEAATPDGDKVYFSTTSPLTADDPNGQQLTPTDPRPIVTGAASASSWDVYEYDFTDDPGDDPGAGVLTRITAGPTGGGDASYVQGSGGAWSVRFVSDDGGRIYFARSAPLPGVGPSVNGTVTAAGGTGGSQGANLYLYDRARPIAERWRFVARLPRASSPLGPCATTGPVQGALLAADSNNKDIIDFPRARCVAGTADGGFVTFFTDGRLTGDDPDEISGDIYGYDADADELVRLSAPQGGGGSYLCFTKASAAGRRCFGDPGFSGRALRVVTEPANPGERTAFFQSKARLVADDGDDEYDVYQWSDGVLSLLSTGTAQGAYYAGNSTDGEDVFVATRDRLSWQDFDAVMDIYDARAGGGIPQPPTPTFCEVLAGGCQGDGFAAVSTDTKTQSSTGSDNVSAERRKSLALSGLSRKARRKAARRGVLPIRLRSNSTGRVRVTAKARLGRRAARVGRKTVRIRKAGAMTVKLRLNKKARKRLRSGKRLRVTVQVRQSGARTRTRSILLPGVKR